MVEWLPFFALISFWIGLLLSYTSLAEGKQKLCGYVGWFSYILKISH
jgi:hypothetical protein